MAVRADDIAGVDPAALIREDEVHRRVYTDPAVFDMEMDRIFGTAWVYVGHESQIPDPGDFVQAYMCETPIILSRGPDGAIHANVNSCTHRGLLA